MIGVGGCFAFCYRSRPQDTDACASARPFDVAVRGGPAQPPNLEAMGGYALAAWLTATEATPDVPGPTFDHPVVSLADCDTIARCLRRRP